MFCYSTTIGNDRSPLNITKTLVDLRQRIKNMAKKHSLSNSEVAITLQYLIASGKLLKRAREGDADSLVFPKDNEKKAVKKKSAGQKGNEIENLEVQETNLTVAIGDLVRSLNVTNELLQKRPIVRK